MILSGDSILDFNITEFFDTHVLQNSLLSLILNKEDQKFINQRLTHLNDEIDINIYGLQEMSSKKSSAFKQIVYKSKIYEESSSKNKIREKGGEKLKFSKRLLNHVSNFDLLYNYDDVHVYLFDKKIYSILEDSKAKEMSPMISDFVSYLINNFYSPRLRNLIYEAGNKENEEQVNNIEDDEDNSIITVKRKLPYIKILGVILERPNYV
jgi:hypothetical protein